MARTRAQRQLYAELLERYGRLVADAFMKAVDDLKRGAELQRVIAYIEARDIEAALDALHIDPEAFNEVADRIREAHAEAGKITAAAMPRRRPDGTALVIRFDGRHPEAEAWLSRQSSDLITRITTEQRDLVRTSLTESLSRGVNPRQAALDVVGRVNRATGRREGGVLGLSGPQEQYVRNARDQLASSDPADLRAYLTRARRDRRFDRSVTKAIREGRPVDPEIAAKAITAYERRLLKLRGDLIGLNETFSALEAAKLQTYEQAIASGKLQEGTVTKVWRHLGALHPRVQHLAMNGRSVGLREDFVMPDGTRMRHAHDPEAPIRHNAGCHCQTDYRVDWFAGLR
ncbi:hypothetical protein [Brevundimonas sp. FT23028]|uniref:hypothetical protein n=1 Tax=Brevundimonas sp. FT23028 TaxID=3393748 RepID=UPI003B5885C3